MNKSYLSYGAYLEDVIRQALADVGLKEGTEMELRCAADQILMYTRPKYFFNNHEVNAGRSVAEKEIADIVSLANQLATAMMKMHKPTFDLLYDRGMRPFDIRMTCQEIEQICRAVDTTSLPQTIPRRKTQGYPQAVADTLAFFYQGLTGKPATIVTKDGTAGGPFLNLVAAVFKELKFKASPESCARTAVRRRRAIEKMPKSPFDGGLMGD